MAPEIKKTPNAALAKRTEALLRSLDADREEMERQKQQGGFTPTLHDAIWEYEQLAKRLSVRLAGNPRTLRRRLGTLKRDLVKRKRIQITLRGMEELGERRCQEAALLADVLGTLVGKLEVTLRPGLARQQSHLVPLPASDQPPPEVHTPECRIYREQRQQQARRREVWIARWYRFCRACGGAGLVDASEPDVGIFGSEACEQCTAQGICPRCGQKALIQDRENDTYKGPCLICWFQFGEGEAHQDDVPPPAPDGPDCICPRPPYQVPPMSEEEAASLLAHQADYDPLLPGERNRAVLRRADR